MKYLFTYILAIISSKKMKIKQVKKIIWTYTKIDGHPNYYENDVRSSVRWGQFAIRMVLFFDVYTSQIKNNVMKLMINCIIHIKHHRNGWRNLIRCRTLRQYPGQLQQQTTIQPSPFLTRYIGTYPFNTLATGTLVMVTDVFFGMMSESFLYTAIETYFCVIRHSSLNKKVWMLKAIDFQCIIVHWWKAVDSFANLGLTFLHVK